MAKIEITASPIGVNVNCEEVRDIFEAMFIVQMAAGKLQEEIMKASQVKIIKPPPGSKI